MVVKLEEQRPQSCNNRRFAKLPLARCLISAGFSDLFLKLSRPLYYAIAGINCVATVPFSAFELYGWRQLCGLGFELGASN